MDTFAVVGFVLGIFGLLAFAQVYSLRKQVYLLRLDIRDAGVKTSSEVKKGSCGCGGGCS